MFCWHVCLYTYAYLISVEVRRESIRSHGIGVPGGCECHVSVKIKPGESSQCS